MRIDKDKQIKEKINILRNRTDGIITTASVLITVTFYYIWFNQGEINNQTVFSLLIVATLSLMFLSIIFQAQTTYFESTKKNKAAFDNKIRDRLNVIDGPVDPREDKMNKLRIQTKKQKLAQKRRYSQSNVIEVPFGSKDKTH